MSTKAKTAVSGRPWAYAGVVVGAVVSIAANVAHSYVPPKTAPTWWPTSKPWDASQWHPQFGAVLGAVFWPVALLLASEILVRIAWPDGWVWVTVRFLGLLPVAAVAAIVSYKHLSALIGYYGEDSLTGHIGPVAVDGLMIMATGALLATAAHGAGHPKDTGADTAADTAPGHEDTAPGPLADTTPDSTSGHVAEGSADVTTDTGPARGRAPRRTSGRSSGRAVKKDTAAIVAEIQAAHPEWTQAQIAAKAGVSDRTVRRHLPGPQQAEADPIPELITATGYGFYGFDDAPAEEVARA
ncbi:hypothetical protein KGQ20_39465 [Catenulispora sp. NF23]|uniref:hypothetical protein n=1 Tax=Catenulispora pinistramenti TaxID=2705254 RepID=UPI001BAB2A68|nr:hypothetical protein [Catenulispora pinistramenti]MBS2538843.1 hypothetical protein [Catenulispora pinistramenti]